MSRLLREFITSVIAEFSDARVPCQLVPKGGKKSTEDNEHSKDSEEEMDEMSVVTNIAGYTAPLGSSSADMAHPGPGKKLKKHKKTFVRWK